MDISEPADPGTAFPFWELAAVGVLSTGLGAATLAWPEVALRIMGLVTGLCLLALAGLCLLRAAVQPSRQPRPLISVMTGAVLAVAGLAGVHDRTTGQIVLALLITCALVGAGLSGIAGGGQPWRAGLGAVSIVTGLGFLLAPDLGLHVLVLVTGVSAVVSGVGTVLFALFADGR